ncbi:MULTISPECIES: hypothetical protein [unclassified Streptomyces]|uniref:hypothetical protein n=1 Tax=unclassified Streptomyces TaxID=2593676 RepID=UPI002E2852DF|nr:hypothetical protein [Streptomyces sp. NBC_00223]
MSDAVGPAPEPQPGPRPEREAQPPSPPAQRGRHRRPCTFCRVHPADLRDHETGLVWCLGCAVELVHAGDPVTDYVEFDEGDRYADLLNRHGRGLYTTVNRRGPAT